MIDKLKHQLRKGKDIEDILEKCDWKRFERIIAEIFNENGFSTKQNFRFRTKRTYEIDVIAVRNDLIFCVDCKWWGRGRYKKAGLKAAVVSQENRVKEFKKSLRRNLIAKKLLRLTQNHEINPLIVTLHEEDMIKEKDTFVVPVWKLNNFLVKLENYI